MPGGLQQDGWREQHPIHTNDNDPWEGLLRWPYAYFGKKNCGEKLVLCSDIKSSEGCFDELGGIWDERAIYVSFSSRRGWGPEKSSFIPLCGSDPKKRNLCRSQDLPPRTPECNVVPSLESQCTVALAPGACRASNTMSFILISLTLLSMALHVCEQAVNISSHCIIHLMHIHV